MAKKRPIEENPPPPASEEEEEEEEEVQGSSEEENESTDDDGTPLDKRTPAPAAVRKPLPFPGRVSDSDSESSSSGPSSPSASAFQFKPVTPKAAKKPTPTASIDSEAAAAAATPGGKKKSSDEEEEEEGKKGVQGRWSEGDEIALLNGMIQYKSEKGSDASSDMGAFLDYIEKSLQNKVTKSSLVTKVRRLKQKYQSLAEKGKADGESPVFSKPHEQKSFELSKRIWGAESEKSERKKSKGKSSRVENIAAGGGGVTLALPKQEPASSSLAPRSAKKPKRAASNGEVNDDQKKKSSSSLGNGEVKTVVAAKVDEKKEVKEDEMLMEKEKKNLCDKYPSLFASMGPRSGDEKVSKVFMDHAGKIDEAKLKEWESRWDKLKRSELELFVQRSSLINEQAKELLDILKSE